MAPVGDQRGFWMDWGGGSDNTSARGHDGLLNDMLTAGLSVRGT